MKTRLITLLTMGRTLDRARDRKGAYTLRNVNKFPKFGPAAGTTAETPPAAHTGAVTQTPLFAEAEVPAAAAAVERKVDGTKGTQGIKER